jgi:hypothetical protein
MKTIELPKYCPICQCSWVLQPENNTPYEEVYYCATDFITLKKYNDKSFRFGQFYLSKTLKDNSMLFWWNSGDIEYLAFKVPYDINLIRLKKLMTFS